MARFQNAATGVVVDVPDAPTFRGPWVPLGPEAPVEARETSDTEADADETEPGSQAPVEDTETTSPALDRPAKSASRADWAAYAESLGYEVENMKRDEIREALDAAAEG